MEWKKRFGGSGYDYFKAVLEDGYVAVGYSDSSSIGNGDWEYIKGKGQDDAIIVKYSLKDLPTKNITPKLGTVSICTKDKMIRGEKITADVFFQLHLQICNRKY